jgi:hypothetical protein
MTKMIFWDVYLKGILIDCVPYDEDCSYEYVKEGLINHDGYNPTIEIKKVI